MCKHPIPLLEELAKDVRVGAALAPSIPRVSRVPGITDVPKIAEVLVHHLVVIELSDVLTT